MMLYKETFPLRKGLRFSSYMKRLNEQVFPPYIFLIEKTDNLKIFNAEIILNEFPDAGFTGFRSFGTEGVLLNKCTIQYYQNERVFTISASISNWNLIMPLFYLGMASSLFLLVFISEITNGMSFENIFVVSGIVFIVIAPFIAMYSNERKLLNRIGQVGAE